MQTYRSLLFVPGARPDRFDKAVAAGADAVLIDLEDAVLPEDKDSARSAVIDWFQAAPRPHVGVRINSPRTATGCRDIGALEAVGITPAFIVVPKTETAADLEIVDEALGGQFPLIGIMETGRALADVFAMARAATGGLLFGGADFSASIGAELSDWDAMLTGRSMVAAAAGAAGVPAYDVPYLDVKDEPGLRETTARARALGFSGRTCIHPAQIGPVNEVFDPSEGEAEEARGIIEALRRAEGGAVLYKGKLVDAPVIRAAERTLSRLKG